MTGSDDIILDEHIGSAFKKRRKELGLRAEDVAMRAGVSTAAINQIETGRRRNARWVTVARIAWALNFRELDEMLPASFFAQMQDEARARLRAIATMDERALSSVVRAADS